MTALTGHRAWCADPRHDTGSPCMSADLSTAHADPGYADQITGAVLNLTDDHGGIPLLSVFTKGSPDSCAVEGFSLRPEQIRPLAMALLAHDALLDGDQVAADYYRGEALRGQGGER